MCIFGTQCIGIAMHACMHLHAAIQLNCNLPYLLCAREEDSDGCEDALYVRLPQRHLQQRGHCVPHVVHIALG